MPLTDDTVFLQEKVDVIALVVKVDNTELSRQYHITSVTIRQEINKIPSAALVLVDGEASEQDFSISSSGEFAPGKKISISLGYIHEDKKKDEPYLFSGIIITNTHKVNNHCCELHVECKDETVKMTIQKSNAHFDKKITPTKLAEQLLGKYKIQKVSVDSVSMKHEQLMQANMSDWDFMIGRMDIAGMYCVINNAEIKIRELKIQKPPKNESGKMLKLVHGRNILEFSADKDSRVRNDEVKVVTWDFKEQKLKEVVNSDSVMENKEGDDKPISSKFEIRTSVSLSEEEQEKVAKTKKMKQDLSATKGKVSYVGRTDITVLPGDFVELKGVGKKFDGFHFISAVQQEYSDGCWITEATIGWTEEFFSEQTSPNHAASGSGQSSSLQGLHIGIVTSILDDEGEYRVQVKLPMVDNNSDGLHARVATLDAGKNRGTFFMPEVDDEVVLGFVNDDPSHPVILGMLHSGNHASPIEPEKSNNIKGYCSRSEIKLLIDDDKKSILIRTPGNRVFDINDDSGSITVEDDFGNKIVMDDKGIHIESQKEINLKAGTKITMESMQISIAADSSFEAKGSGSAKIEGGGITEIKGGLVKIN